MINQKNEARYKNYYHYIQEEWSSQPKQSFLRLLHMVEQDKLPNNSHCLDIGCATGELIHFLSNHYSNFHFTGVDIFDALLDKAKNVLPKHTFLNQSVLNFPLEMTEKFDLITAVGVMSIFDEKELVTFWENILSAAKPGGKIYIFSPLNEYGVDLITIHRKRINARVGSWEKGWNIYSLETMHDILSSYSCAFAFEKFEVTLDLPRREDPVRTWTMTTASRSRQLTNGFKLLIDHYFIKVTKLG